MSRENRQGFFATFKGVIAAFMGVQSRQQHEEAFAKGSVISYIVIGLSVVVLFIAIVITVVSLVLSSAGL